jgi:hypothetical protein
MKTEGHNALIVSYAEVAKDPRVRNQITWLKDAGYTVNVVGRGSKPSGLNGQYWETQRWPLLVRLLTYLFASNQFRYQFLMEFWLKRNFMELNGDRTFNLIVLNTLDYLPWINSNSSRLSLFGDKVLLDLHEYSPSQGVGLIWKVMFRRYQNWLLKQISSQDISFHTTVAPGISELYAQEFSIPKPEVIMNVPPFENLKPKPVVSGHIKLIHHGKADNARGLPYLVDAMQFIDERFTLTFMLVGSSAQIDFLKRRARRLGLEKRIFFRTPVELSEVATVLNDYDAEIIFTAPTTINYKHALPNKYFEAVQGRIAIVTGASEEIVAISREFANCAIAQEWNIDSLVRTINAISDKQLSDMKIGSNSAAKVLNLAVEGKKFVRLISS